MMLQQTQVKTVLPYYERWMRALPSWRSLDRAPIDRVLKLWEGLGYYRRARNLKAAARMVMEEYDGKLPENEEQILRLPGVGPYSAGAILSIAFNRPTPVVDGNVIRVFSRIFAIRGDLKSGPGHKQIWRLAEYLLPHQRPGDFNQALMEWGATLCLPTDPRCSVCPWTTQCRAKKMGRIDQYPSFAKRPSTKSVFMAAVLIQNNGSVLIRKRPESSRWWKGLWEFPSAEGRSQREAASNLEKELGLSFEKAELANIQHQITNHRVEISLYRAAWLKHRKKPIGFRWVSPKDWSRYALPSAHMKIRRLTLNNSAK
jgi:A/G-specific adenine glycosylase